MASFVCCALVAGTFLVSTTPAASACSCTPPLPAAEAAENAEWVFVARQISKEFEDSADGRKARLQMEVLSVYKGDVPDELELQTNAGGADCGVDFSDLGAVGFTITPLDDGTVQVYSCSGTYLPDEIQWLYEPLPTGTRYGNPGFVVGTDVSPARIAILDEQARLIAYGLGEGRLVDAAVCPGAQKIVEVVGPDDEWSADEAARPFIEVRDVATLDVERHFDIDLPEGDLNQLAGDWVIDMQCHDPNGDFVTYLLPMVRWDSPALAHVWRNGKLTVVNLEGAKAIAVDPDRELTYTIVGGDGMNIEIRDLAGDLIDTMPVPLGQQAWKLAFPPDRSELVLLTTDHPMRSEHWFYAEVNSLLVMDVETGEAKAYPLPETGNAYFLAARSDGFTAATFHLESLSMIVTSLRDGEVEVVGEYPAVLPRTPVTVGSRTVLLVDTEESDAHAVLALDLFTGEQLPIVNLIRSSVAVALPGPVPSAQPLPVVATTAPSTTSTTTSTSPGSTTTAPPVTAITTEPEPDADEAAWPIVAGVVLVVALLGFRVSRLRRGRR